MRSQWRPALVLLVYFTVLTGVVYPLAVMAIGQLAFHAEAEGSVIASDGRVAGSRLIGQSFTSPGYFWSRLSATAHVPYDASASTGTNLGPLAPALTDAARARIAALRAADSTLTGPIPVDLVTSSGSGLDPEESPEAAFIQVPRVARARGLEPAVVRALVERHLEPRTLGVFGEPRVNVLMLNLSLDSLAHATR